VRPALGRVLEPALGQVPEPALGQVLEPALGQVLEPALGLVLEPALESGRHKKQSDHQLIPLSSPVQASIVYAFSPPYKTFKIEALINIF